MPGVYIYQMKITGRFDMSDTDFVVVYVDEAAATATTTTTTTTTSTTETTTSTTTTSTGPVETNWFFIAAVGVGAIVFTVVLIVFYRVKVMK